MQKKTKISKKSTKNVKSSLLTNYITENLTEGNTSPVDLFFKFAHMADLHIGSHSEPILRDIEMETLDKAITKCLEENISFLIISGDIFDSNLPNLEIVDKAVVKFKQLRDRGIPIYYVSGSHDFSVGQTSIVNILESAGIFTRVSKGTTTQMINDNGQLDLSFQIDPVTQAKLTGIGGRIRGNEKAYYELLHREPLEAESGFKIFVFHTGIEELKPSSLVNMESIPLTLFPRSFDYYAGGHIHKKIQTKFGDFGIITYPGTLFSGQYKDLEESALGEERGFYIIDVKKGIPKPQIANIRFSNVQLYPYDYWIYSANHKTAKTVFDELYFQSKSRDVENKIVILKIHGELAAGKTSDINFAMIRNEIMNRGAKFVSLNRYNLHSKEVRFNTPSNLSKDELEFNIFLENIDSVKVSNQLLKGQSGAKTAQQLLVIFREIQKDNEKLTDYQERIKEQAQSVLKLKENLK